MGVVTPGTYQAQVSTVRHLTGGYCLVTFDLPAAFGEAAPGQFVMVRAPGRYPLLARPFSLHDVRRSGRIARADILFKEVGEGTRALAALCKGGEATLWGPLGKGFTLTNPGPHVLVAGGRGIAPMWFFARKLYEGKKAAERPEVDLFYGACSSDELHYIEEFRDLNVRVHVATDDGSRGSTGLVTALLRDKLGIRQRPAKPASRKKPVPAVAQLGMFEAPAAAPVEAPPPAPPVSRPVPYFYACGPTKMMAAVHEAAAALGARCEVSLESHMACGIGVCLGCAHGTADGGMLHVCKAGPVLDSAVVFGAAPGGGAEGRADA